jgi:hypothetical protein
MGIVRDIIAHVEVEVAQRARLCHHNQKEHKIRKGDKCLAIHDANGGRKNYCGPCAQDILTKAKTKLAGMEQQFQN